MEIKLNLTYQRQLFTDVAVELKLDTSSEAELGHKRWYGSFDVPQALEREWSANIHAQRVCDATRDGRPFGQIVVRGVDRATTPGARARARFQIDGAIG